MQAVTVSRISMGLGLLALLIPAWYVGQQLPGENQPDGHLFPTHAEATPADLPDDVLTAPIPPAFVLAGIAAAGLLFVASNRAAWRHASRTAASSREPLENEKHNEAIFQLAMKNAPIGMALVSPKGAWLRVNHVVCEIVGYDESELLAIDFQTITHPDDLDKDLTLLQQVLRKEIDAYHIEKRYIRKNGETVWILLSVSLVWDHDDKPLYFISQIQDIQARKEAEEEIRISKERLELALRGGGLGTWDWRIPEDSVHYDRRWAEMLGYTIEELHPNFSTWNSVVHPDDKAGVMASLECHLRGETESYEAEHRLRHKDGSWIWVLTKGKVIARERSGEPLRVCGTHLDITPQKNAQESLAQFARELERSNKDLEDFAYIASHDLKEPLRGIRNYATFVLEDYEDKLDEAGQSKLHTMVTLTTRLGALIDALLHFSRVGQMAITFGPVDLQKTVQDVVESLHGWLEEMNGQVSIDGPLPSLPCHSVLAAEVFRNLITNGIKYNTNECKNIVVGTSSGPDGVPVFFVRDNGIGITEKHHASVFRMFKRLNGRDAFGDGAGAGLSISQKIVHRHGGRIWLESVPDGGTTFYFTLSGDGPATD